MTHDGKAAREAWLTQIGEAMAPHIAATVSEVTGGEVRFKGWRVSCGWPHKGGLPASVGEHRGPE